jgi:hypothetical protein
MDVTLKRQDNRHKGYQNFPLIHQVCSNVKVILIIFLGYIRVVHREFVPKGDRVNKEF